MNTTAFIQCVNGCSRGDDASYRDGRQITMDAVEVAGQISQDSAASNQTVRLMLVYDTETRGSAPTITEILSGSSVYNPANRDNLQRFKILYDKCFTIYPKGYGPEAFVKKKIRFRLPVQYNVGDTATITDIVYGSLLFVALGSNPVGTSDVAFNGMTQVLFHDL